MKTKLTEIEIVKKALKYLGIIEKQQEKLDAYKTTILELQKENETLRGMVSDYSTQFSEIRKETLEKKNKIPENWKKQTLNTEFKTIFV